MCVLQVRKRSAKHRHQLFQKPLLSCTHAIGCREGWDRWVFSWDRGVLNKIGALVRKKNIETRLAPHVLSNVVLGNSVTSPEQTDLSGTFGGCAGGACSCPAPPRSCLNPWHSLTSVPSAPEKQDAGTTLREEVQGSMDSSLPASGRMGDVPGDR